MNRRDFVLTAVAAGAGSQLASAISPRQQTSTRKFTMKYAPHFGMFRHHAGDDPVDQLQFVADEGFSAWEDNGMAGRSVDEQKRIAAAMEKLGITMGVFVATANWGQHTFVRNDDNVRNMLRTNMTKAVEIADRANAQWCTVLLDNFDPRVDRGYQTANAIDNLKRCAEICEPAGLVMVLEPLNPRDHPGLFLAKMSDAYEICSAVGSPSCKILDDLYHQQVTEGNLIPNIDRAWDEIAYFQLGDNPGRNEPTTGEINYRNIFAHLHHKGFDGIIGMEHGNSRGGKEGERAVIDAYRACDRF